MTIFLLLSFGGLLVLAYPIWWGFKGFKWVWRRKGQQAARRVEIAMQRLESDPKAFHAWAVECVVAAHNGGPVFPLLVAQYFAETATKEWAWSVLLPAETIAFMDHTKELGLAPLMRFQVSLSPSDKEYFEKAVVAAGY